MPNYPFAVLEKNWRLALVGPSGANNQRKPLFSKKLWLGQRSCSQGLKRELSCVKYHRPEKGLLQTEVLNTVISLLIMYYL